MPAKNSGQARVIASTGSENHQVDISIKGCAQSAKINNLTTKLKACGLVLESSQRQDNDWTLAFSTDGETCVTSELVCTIGDELRRNGFEVEDVGR